MIAENCRAGGHKPGNLIESTQLPLPRRKLERNTKMLLLKQIPGPPPLT